MCSANKVTQLIHRCFKSSNVQDSTRVFKSMHWVSNVLCWVIGVVPCQGNLLNVVITCPCNSSSVAIAYIVGLSVVGNVNNTSIDGAEK